MDFWLGFASLGLPGWRRHRGQARPPGPPSSQTLIAALLVALAATPGIWLMVVTAPLMTNSNDFLAPVSGLVGLVGFGAGLGFTGYLLTGAGMVAARAPGARVAAIALGATVCVVAPVVSGIIGGRAGVLTLVLLVGYGAGLIALLLTPAVGRDFPAPRGPGSLPPPGGAFSPTGPVDGVPPLT